MWLYQKKLQYPINIKKKDLAFAKQLITQYGGFAGELGAALRYLNQRYILCLMIEVKHYLLLLVLRN